MRPSSIVRLTAVLAALLTAAGCARSTGDTAARAATTASAADSAASAPAKRLHRLASGLVYEDMVVGNGTMADPGLTASVHYTGWLENGTKFDSSLDRGRPYSFTLGAGQVIRGWDEGVKGMRVGGRRRLTIPSDLAYGPGGRGPIPPNATLIFEVELVGVQ